MCDVRARRIVPLYKGLPSGALALKADMRELLRYVCFVPNADIRAPSDHVSSNPFRTFTSTSSRSSVATWLDQSVFLNRLYRKSQWLAPCMMVCVRVTFMSGSNPSAMVKSALQTSRKPSSGSPNSL